MRLIDADALISFIDMGHLRNPLESCFSERDVVDMLESRPTIEAEPVKHGDWELRHVGHGHYWECSVCHKNPCIYVTKDTKFCPNCGAKMDGGDTNA